MHPCEEDNPNSLPGAASSSHLTHKAAPAMRLAYAQLVLHLNGITLYRQELKC